MVIQGSENRKHDVIFQNIIIKDNYFEEIQSGYVKNMAMIFVSKLNQISSLKMSNFSFIGNKGVGYGENSLFYFDDVQQVDINN